jgi:4-aminobutyrate aminotransferase-like enzyme
LNGGVERNECSEEGEESGALSLRYKYLANMQEHYFSKSRRVRGDPPIFLRGSGAYMFDSYGRAYLDMVNNVALVGHSHAGVTAAAAEQLRLLNTNSRFIYPALGQYTRLLSRAMTQATTPLLSDDNATAECQWVVFLVNSGSEATDLALRMARTVANHRREREQAGHAVAFNRNVISLCGAYHGVTTASDEVSTTLNDNPRSLLTRPPWIHLVPLPNMYRGAHRLPKKYLYAYHQNPTIALTDDETPESFSQRRDQLEDELAEKYAGSSFRRLSCERSCVCDSLHLTEYVREKCEKLSAEGAPPTAFIAEPLSGNAGGVCLPRGYLKRVYRAVRAVGGLCICDVVQVGYGRLSKVSCHLSLAFVVTLLTLR